MYDELYLHNPAEVTQTEDFPRKYSRSYCHRTEVHQYLKDYAQHFDLRRQIKFNTAVTLITPLSQDEFQVTTRDSTGNCTTEIFNRIAVANGHFSVPYVPEILGAETFPGQIIHSHNLKRSEPALYQDKHVVVSGATRVRGTLSSSY
jgi:trimethylamine monooxygenase